MRFDLIMESLAAIEGNSSRAFPRYQAQSFGTFRSNGRQIVETSVQQAIRCYDASAGDIGAGAGCGGAGKKLDQTCAHITRYLSDLETLSLSRADLGALRRRIAKLCHPDRRNEMSETYWGLMSLANAKIDAAIERTRDA